MPFSVATLSNTWTFTGCEFRNNYNGLGAIVVLQYSDVSIIDTRFTNSRGMQSLHILNSVISIEKSVFQHNHGSAITLKDSVANIFDLVFDGNQGRGAEFGGALTSYDSVIHIHSNEFKNNVATFRGGTMLQHLEVEQCFVMEA